MDKQTLINHPQLSFLSQWQSGDRLLSVFDNVPIEHLTTALGEINKILSGTAFSKQIRYRGLRTSNPQHTLKKDATAFSVYLTKRPVKRKVDTVPETIVVNGVTYRRVK